MHDRQEWASVRITRGDSPFTRDDLAELLERHARVGREVAEAMAGRVLDGGAVSLDVPSPQLADQLRRQLRELGLEAA